MSNYVYVVSGKTGGYGDVCSWNAAAFTDLNKAEEFKERADAEGERLCRKYVNYIDWDVEKDPNTVDKVVNEMEYFEYGIVYFIDKVPLYDEQT